MHTYYEANPPFLSIFKPTKSSWGQIHSKRRVTVVNHVYGVYQCSISMSHIYHWCFIERQFCINLLTNCYVFFGLGFHIFKDSLVTISKHKYSKILLDMVSRLTVFPSWDGHSKNICIKYSLILPSQWEWHYEKRLVVNFYQIHLISLSAKAKFVLNLWPSCTLLYTKLIQVGKGKHTRTR